MPPLGTTSSQASEILIDFSLKPCYIYINGYPGIGKLTVAKELEKLIVGSKVIHNHVFIDPIAAIVDRSDIWYDELRTSMRRHILDIIATSSATGFTTWIFTDSRSTSSVGSMGAEDYEDAAAQRGVPFISIILNCSLEENLKRAGNEDRGGSTTKLTDLEVVRAIREEEQIYRYKGEMEMDITCKEPREAALEILEHVRCCYKLWWGT